MKSTSIAPFAHLVVVALCAWGLAACGGDGASPETTPTPAVTLSGLHADLDELLNSMEAATFRVVYMTDEDGEALVVYNAPPRTRIDTVPANADEPISSLIATGDDNAVYSCEDGPDNWRCFGIESSGRSLLRTAAPVTFSPAWELAGFGVREAKSRTIAGQEARCFILQPPDDDELEYCLTDEGVLLYSSPTFGTVQAVEFSKDVSEEDFDLPVPPQ